MQEVFFMTAISAITDYLLTGECPEGVSPEIMEQLADIVDLFQRLREQAD